MRIAIVGAGYVGLVSSACFADTGNEVTCVDRDPERISRLGRGEMPLWEPNLEELVRRGQASGRLTFREDGGTAIARASAVFLAVGTPSGLDAAVDLGDLDRAVADIAPLLAEDAVLVLKSTVPVGTWARVTRRLREAGRSTAVVSNPEFLREGSAIADFRSPDRVLVGTTDPRAAAVLRELYAPFLVGPERLVVMDPASAELTKYAANSLLAARISFVNELSGLAERCGADIDLVSRGLGMDHRIGADYLQASLGWGGSCFPKDVSALVALGRELGAPMRLAEAALQANEHHKRRWIDRVIGALSPPTGKRVAVWGLAFKANTSDVRHSPGLDLVRALSRAGATVAIHDPHATREIEGDRVEWADDPYAAAEGAHALAICTEWPEYRSPDFDRLEAAMVGRDVFDGRNLWSPEWPAVARFRYHRVGRATTQ